MMARCVLTVGAAALCAALAHTSAFAQDDLDRFMRRVLQRRDDNWRKLQQYVLDEREVVEIHGPGGVPVWGERRDYTWFIQDGFFVRSPVEVNGATVGERERREYEARFLQREQAREKRVRPNATGSGDGSQSPSDLADVIRQTRQPQFISSAYFLRFKFDEGQYAFVGPESLDGVETLKVEYYPRLLFTDATARRRQQRSESEKIADEQMRELLNKGSRVTLWILPESYQIVRYTATNVDLEFFPLQWLATVNSASVSMSMAQPFPDVWLPDRLELDAALMFAFGAVDVRYRLDFHGYRQAEVTSTIRVPDGP
jgi:hypothetical protein